MLFAYILFVGIIFSRQTLIRLQYKLASINIIEVKSSSHKLSDKEKEEIIKSLEKYLITSKSYLSPNFSLKLLSLKLHIPSNKLSYVVNSVYGTNFRSFINRYRIEHVKKLLGDAENNSKLDNIHNSIGFYSKSHFFKAFKDITGLTPREYKRQAQKK